MKKSLNLISAVAVILSLIAVSCNQADLEKTATAQEEAIESFLKNKYQDSTIVNNGGVNRVVLIKGEGAEAAAGDSVFFKFQEGIFNNGNITTICEGEYASVLGNKSMIQGLDKGITGMKKEESAMIIFSARYGYYDSKVSVVPSMSALVYYVYLKDIKKSKK